MPTPVLAIDNLSIAFAGVPSPLVRGVNLRVNAGEIVALVGESGSGKSLTAQSVLRLLPDSAHYPDGSIRVQGEDILDMPPKKLRAVRGGDVGMIFQEPMTALNPLHTVFKQIREALVLHQSLDKAAVRERVRDLLAQVGLEADASRIAASYPHQLSGGQRQRVMIAMAIANNPKLLVADEPTTALDVTVQQQILTLLKDLQRQRNMGLLLITHDLALVKRFAETVYVMRSGEIVEHGSVASVFSKPQHSYTKALLEAVPTGRPPGHDEAAAPVYEARDVKVWFPKQKSFWGRPLAYTKAVDGISLSVKPGQTLGIVGESGSGKTTLGLALLRLVDAKGDLLFRGQSLQKLRQGELRPVRRHLQVVFQDPYGSLSPRLTVGDIIAEGLDVHRLASSREDKTRRVEQALKDVGLKTDMLRRYPHEFSGGQRQRIAIARALVLEPELMVLDEPTSALDRHVQVQIVELLRGLQQKRGLAYIFISHDLQVVRAISHQVLVMKDGRVVEQGDAAAIFSSPQQAYTKALLEAAFLTEEKAA